MSPFVHVTEDALNALRELQTDDEPSFFSDLMLEFVKVATEKTAEIGTAVGNGNAKAVALAAHSLKSSSYNVGAEKMGKICSELEAQGKAGLTDGLQQRLDELMSEWAEVKREILSLPELARR